MNPNAKAFFEANPEEKYWYYSDTLRVPNPVLMKRPDWVDEPFPKELEQ